MPTPIGRRELRLALVCYGGVSLAIYMHGLTKEIGRLVLASRRFEQDPDNNPFDQATDSCWAYWEALRERQSRDANVQTRVVVDIVAGTSAGGINGICLAKSLVEGVSDDALRQLWIDRGDVNELTHTWVPTRYGKILAREIGSLVARLVSPRGRPQAPFDGDRMFTWAYQALGQMDAARIDMHAAPPLLPDDHELQLFVTTTDLLGYARPIAIDWPPTGVFDERYRVSMEFVAESAQSSGRRNDFTAAGNGALSLAIRATSSFPGAFPPVAVGDVGRLLGSAWTPAQQTEMVQRFFREHELAGYPVEGTYLVDGGVLDNYPFDRAIDAIVARPADMEVRRRLVYIEPDPLASPEHRPTSVPSQLENVWRSLLTIPRSQPIADQLDRLRQFDDRVRRVRVMIAAATPAVHGTLSATVRGENVDTSRDTMHDAAKTESGPAWVAYTRLKLWSVVDQLAATVAQICNYPDGSSHALFAQESLCAWATERRLLPPADGGDDPTVTPDQLDFLRTFDFAYTRRRIRFLVDAVNALYPNAADGPARQRLNAAKTALYARREELSRAVAGAMADPELVGAVRTLYDEEMIQAALTSSEVPFLEAAANHGGGRAEEIDAMRAEATRRLNAALGGFPESLRSTVEQLGAAGLPVIVDRYLAFPVWDVLIFPMITVGDAGELDEIRVVRLSPREATLLGYVPETKLEGRKLGHFEAFFSRKARQNDYLWGRLDGAEQLIRLLLDEGGGQGPLSALGRSAFLAVLAQEQPTLGDVSTLIGDLRRAAEGPLTP